MDPILGLAGDVNPGLESAGSTSAVVAEGCDTILQLILDMDSIVAVHVCWFSFAPLTRWSFEHVAC